MSTIIRATAEHVDSILAIAHVVELDDSRRLEIERAIDEESCWVILEGDYVAGHAIMDRRFFRRSFIWLVYIAEGHRRQGLGRKMLLHLEQKCGTSELFTSTNESNLPAQGLLESLGYMRTGVIENLDPGDPELVYRKVLR